MQGGRRQFHISPLAGLPACSCVVLGPPVEGSQQHKELGGENTQSPVLKENGGALTDRAQRPMRDTEKMNIWRLSGGVFLDAGLNRRYSVDMESCSETATPPVNPLSPGKASWAGTSLAGTASLGLGAFSGQ